MLGIFKRKAQPLLPAEQQQQIVQAIQEAEQCTSGEVRVFIESRCSYVDAMDRAREVFYHLKMEHIRQHNAVLIYVALTDRQTAVFGDEGIYRKTGGDPYWAGVLNSMRLLFQQNKIAEGIASAARQIGKTLSEHFPYDAQTDKNELPDDIVFGH